MFLHVYSSAGPTLEHTRTVRLHLIATVKLVLSGHSKIDITKIFMINGCLLSFFFSKIIKMSQKVSSAAVVIGALRVKRVL